MSLRGILRALAFTTVLAVFPAARAGEALPAFHRLVGDLAGPDRVLRYRASEGLGALGDLEAVPYLIAALEDPDPGLRALAGSALSRLTGRGWGQDPGRWRGWWDEQGGALIRHRGETGQRAVAALAAPSYEIRFSAARTLETLGFREGIPALIQALGTHELPFRWRCVRSLEVLSGERFGLDAARWSAWWEAARAARLSDPPPVQAPAVPPSAPPPSVAGPQAPPRLVLDPEGILAQRARRLEEERNALEARLASLQADRDRLAEASARAREALEASQAERARLHDAGSAATSQSQARVAALERELAERRSRTESLEAESRKAAQALEEAARRAASLEAEKARLEAALAAPPPAPTPTVPPEELAREREKAAALAATLAREREDAKALTEEAEALRRKLAERPEPGPPPVPPAVSPEELSRAREQAAELADALDREREEARALAEEAEALRRRLAERPEPSPEPPVAMTPAAGSGRVVAASGADRELAAWRARHERLWGQVQDYVIQRDDNLSGIARRFHTDVETLMDLNAGNTRAIRDRHRIYAGYRINVPGS